MAPLIVDGDTLGQKHRNYNKIFNEAIKNTTTPQLTVINYEEPDLDNIFKIDIACNSRNVEYILEVLKCEDMLYVSRAIKQSIWLITDPQYSYIVNPDYLYTQLLPTMTVKAFNKLILHIRLNLKDEKRVEEFFNYYKEKDLQKALKWLPHCSIPIIENIVQKHANDIPKQLLKRLCEKSFTVLVIFHKRYKAYSKREILKQALFLLNNNVNSYLDIIEATDMGDTPYFGPKFTKILMEKAPERIMNNLEKYVDILDISTFAKFLKKEDVKPFILTQIKNKKMRSWFTYRNIKHFLNRLPFDERFAFIKKIFIEKTYEIENLEDETMDDVVRYCSASVRGNTTSAKDIYSWYVYAPFNKAFADLKQYIRNESNPTERIWILQVLLTCARSDIKNILILLKYYRENHINEPFKFKIQFINHLLTKTDTHRYNKEAWGYLNSIFNSMELYSKCDKNVQSCVTSIILYNVIHGENIPDVIEGKFTIGNLPNKNKFNDDEKEKIFNYLYNHLISKIKNDYKSENEFDETVGIVEDVLNLLSVWNKELHEYPIIIEKIKDLIAAKKENSWSRDLSRLYCNIKKSWRRLLFAESIILNPSQDSCINALKHDPMLLDVYMKEVVASCTKDNVVFDRFFKIIRTYWCESLANSFKTKCTESLKEKSNTQALLRGLCILYSQKELLGFVQKHVPTDPKIDWGQPNESEINLRKYISMYMHLARPQPPLAVALLYAKGDYLQYILPSLNSILYNINSTYICENLTNILDTPVSLQKHGVRVAFSKLKLEEIKNVFSKLWLLTKNNSIRAYIFNQTYMMLCRERDESVILQVWELMSVFMDTLTLNENKIIYSILNKGNNVPLSIRTAFLMKCHGCLKKLPKNANCSDYDAMIRQMSDITDFQDDDFIANIFFEYFDIQFSTKKYSYAYQVALFMLSTKTEKAQKDRYEIFFVPLLDKALKMWDQQHENFHYTRFNLARIIDYMCSEINDVVLDKEMVFPIFIFTSMLNKLQSRLSVNENYALLTDIKLSLGYIKILKELKMNKELDFSKPFEDEYDKWKHLHSYAAPIFGKFCLDYLKNDTEKYFSSIYNIFADRLNHRILQFVWRYLNLKLGVLKVFLDCKDFIQGQLLVIKLIPNFLCECDDEALRSEMLNEIRSHPSQEVALHYWNFIGKGNDI